MKTHVSLKVADIRRSIEFYSKMLGIEPVKIKEDYAKFDVANPPLNLTLNKAGCNRRRTAVPFGFAGGLHRRCGSDFPAMGGRRADHAGREGY